MAWTGEQTGHGDGTKRVVVRDEDGTVIYDMTVDTDTVFTGPVNWGEQLTRTGGFPGHTAALTA